MLSIYMHMRCGLERLSLEIAVAAGKLRLVALVFHAIIKFSTATVCTYIYTHTLIVSSKACLAGEEV